MVHGEIVPRQALVVAPGSGATVLFVAVPDDPPLFGREAPLIVFALV